MNKKTLKTTNCLTAYLATGLLISQASYAGIVGVRTSGTSGAPAGKTSSSVVVTPGKAVDERVIKKEGTAGVSCTTNNADAATYFPLSFFQSLSLDGSSLTFEQRPDNKILVKIPAIINNCGKFKPQLIQDDVTKSVTIVMQLEDGSSYSSYLACLETKNILVDGKIDHDKTDGKEYSETPYILDYSFSKDKDIKKTLKLSYGYPKEYSRGKDSYESMYGYDNDVELPGSLCMRSEKIQPEITYINKGQDVLIDELKAICKSGDAQRIAEARKSIGNADALKDIAEKIKSELDAGYLVAVKQDVEKISSSMLKIEDRLTKERDTIDETTAKKLARQYADLSKELDSKFLNPAIFRLDTLMKQVADMDLEDPKRKGADDEIKKINEDVGAFAARKSGFPALYSVMEKYSINDSAKTIEDIRLKSYWYGTVYSGPADDKRGKPITFEEANQKQYAGLQKFDKVLTDWTDQYLVGKGNLAPIQKTERERTATYEKMNKRWYDYQNDEQAKLQKYCAVGMMGSPKNPVQCQAFQAGAKGRQDAELARRRKDLMFIQGRNDKLNKMGSSYNDYQRRQVANETRGGDNEPYGASYTSYEDNFSDRFPGYYGAQTYTPYDASNYNMGGQAAAMNMGNTGNYNASMINPQMQVQQGQYQMPQQGYGMNGGQMGGWPSI
ncbi:MAG: hypothetical protein PHY93_07855 [Bacteriovorax sp.]|nr:hypothetical protein [Bacteriovorax sp.]